MLLILMEIYFINCHAESAPLFNYTNKNLWHKIAQPFLTS